MKEKGIALLTAAVLLVILSSCVPTEIGTASDERLEVATAGSFEAVPREIQEVAFDFFEAYMRADIEAATALMGGECNELPEYFPSSARPLDSVEIWNMELIYEKRIEDGNIPYIQVGLDLQIYEKEYNSCKYMCLTLVNRGPTSDSETDSGKWAVAWYDFEA